MNTILAISGVVIKELYRRKDFYVLFIMTAVLTLLLGAMNFYNDKGVVRYLQDICLLLIWVSALVIAIVTTSRQIPAERENRTIFPLLAKPVTRAQFIVGKFLGCWLACGIALVVFYGFFGLVTASRAAHWPVNDLLKAAFLHWAMLGIVASLALLGSVVFTAPSSNSTICLIVVAGILLMGGHLNKVAVGQPEPLRSVIDSVYYLLPHLEWYDQREQLSNGQAVAAWKYCGLAALYALVYTGALLQATWLVFRRKPLNV
jgi:Cu-processing system permease protein